MIVTTERDKRLKNLNKDINGMLHQLADYRKRPETEKLFFSKQKCEKNLAEAYYTKLQLTYPKAEALYASCITECCTKKGIELMIKYNLIETCGMAENGEKLYAI